MLELLLLLPALFLGYTLGEYATWRKVLALQAQAKADEATLLAGLGITDRRVNDTVCPWQATNYR